MGEVHDPWESEYLACPPAGLLQGEVANTISFLGNLNWSGFRLSSEQAEVIYRWYLEERTDPVNWMALDVVLTALALARHPKVPDLVEHAFGMGDFDFTGVACRGLLAWHGLPHLHLIWVDALDERGFDEMPPAAQDYIRGLDLSGTWQRVGIGIYFEDATPEKIKLMSQAFVRMEMPGAAAALSEAAGCWKEVKAVHALNLSEKAHYAAFDPLYAKWEAAAWRMNDDKDCLLEGISRFAAKHASEMRAALGWTAPHPYQSA